MRHFKNVSQKKRGITDFIMNFLEVEKTRCRSTKREAINIIVMCIIVALSL